MKRKPAPLVNEQTPPDGAILLTKSQMAAAIQISEKTLQKMMREGRIVFYRLRTQKTVRFNPTEVLAQLEKTCRQPEKTL